MAAASHEPSEITEPFVPRIPAHLGAYRLERKVGQGGMGMVFAATHTLMKRKAAVKIIRPSYTQDELVVQRFRREIALLAQVPDHRNLVRAQYAGEDQGLLYLAMDYVDGFDLNALIERLGPLPPNTACELIAQAADGLEAIHRAGFVHRDLKPSNLMLTSDGVVKILDLGLARLIADDDFEELTPTHCHLGTADYQAPEQASDAHNVDIRADIYSLGCTLYKLLTGQAPYADSPSPLAKMQRHARGQFPRLAEDTPPELSTVMSRMVAPRVEHRFSTPAELAQELRRLANGSELSECYQTAIVSAAHKDILDAPTVTSTGQQTDVATTLARPRKKRRDIVIGVCLAVALGAAYLALLYLRRDQEPGQPEKASPAAIVKKDPISELPRPKAIDGLPELIWHELLESEPVEVLLNTADGAAFAKYDAKLKQFAVTSPRNAVFLFGETTQPSFTYQVGLMQIGWSSGAGIVLGYQADDPTGKQRYPGKFQFLVMQTQPNEKGILQFRITRGKAKIVIQGGRVNVSPISVASEEIINPLGEQVIEVRVENHRVGEVRVNGAPLYKLTTPDVEREFQPADCIGGVGTINVVNSCTYRKASIKLHPIRN